MKNGFLLIVWSIFLFFIAYNNGLNKNIHIVPEKIAISTSIDIGNVLKSAANDQIDLGNLFEFNPYKFYGGQLPNVFCYARKHYLDYPAIFRNSLIAPNAGIHWLTPIDPTFLYSELYPFNMIVRSYWIKNQI